MTFIVKCAPVLKEWNFCCCSCSLRAAAIVLAWILTILVVSELVTCVSYLSHSAIQPENSYGKTKILISLLSTLVGTLILDVLLLYGIHNKKPVYMLPFLVFEMFFIMVMTVFVFAGGIVATVSYCCYWELGVKALIVGSVSVLVSTLFWVVLYSYYRQMEEEKNPNSGIVNCMYQVPNDQVQMLPGDDKVPSYFPNKLAPDMA